MKMRNVMLLGGLVALVGLLASCMPQTFSASQMMDRMNAHAKSELQLTPDQFQKLQVLSDAFKAKMKIGEADRKAREAEALAMIQAPMLDQAKIREMMKAGMASANDGIDATLDEFLPKIADFHDSLNDVQRKKIADDYSKLLSKMVP